MAGWGWRGTVSETPEGEVLVVPSTPRGAAPSLEVEQGTVLDVNGTTEVSAVPCVGQAASLKRRRSFSR